MDKAVIKRVLQIAGAVIVVALVIGLYRAKSDAAKTEAHVHALQAEVSEREAGLRALRADIAEQESPANIERLAEERLGAVVGSESAALPESALDDRLPPPQRRETP